MCQNSYTRGLSTLPACKIFITQKNNIFLVHECTGENVASLSGWEQSSRPKPHQSAIIWNLETLTGIWGIFTNKASGEEAHEDSWRKEMKWKTIKWIMASLHTHPSQWRRGWGSLVHPSRHNTVLNVSRIGAMKPKPHIKECCTAFLEGLCAYLASWIVKSPPACALPLHCKLHIKLTDWASFGPTRQSISIKGWSFKCWTLEACS